MSNNTIIFAGPKGVGVTTAIKSISNTAPVMKKEKVKDDNDKEVTVEMDYGILKLDSLDQIHLYGAADRVNLKHFTKALNDDFIGLIILIDNSDTDPVGTMLSYMEDCQTHVDKKGIAVGLTRYDDSPSPDINDFHVALREKKINIPVFPVFSIDGHEKNDIIMVVRALLYNLDSGVN
jgi:signal recognition particle receptor subunit beta